VRRRRLGFVVVATTTLLAACSNDDAQDATPTTQPTTTVASSSTTTEPGSQRLLDAACADELSVQATGTIDPSLTSVSGLAASAQHDGIVWAAEDSLEPAVVTALRTDGSTSGASTVRAGLLANVDWEALSFDHALDEPRLYVGDLGDNLGIRPRVRLYELAEPDPTATTEVEPLRRLDLEYRRTDGSAARPNAEALVVHGGTAWVIDKQPDGPATVYRAELDAPDGVLHEVGTLDLPGEQVTGVDLSPDATVLALRTNRAVRVLPATLDDEGRLDLVATLTNEGCGTPVPPEDQGEAITVLPGAGGLVTVGEDEGGTPVPMHLIAPG
jgi:hypothetical protein